MGNTITSVSYDTAGDAIVGAAAERGGIFIVLHDYSSPERTDTESVDSSFGSIEHLDQSAETIIIRDARDIGIHERSASDINVDETARDIGSLDNGRTELFVDYVYYVPEYDEWSFAL